MSIIAEPFKEGGENFPQNKIVLADGRVLDCYPLAEEVPEKPEDDPLELDKTGQYLVVDRRKPSPTPPPTPTVEWQRQRFVDNAFYLLAHSERILSDSRMFLCPVAVQNGIAYTGTSGFRRPTLGVYIEWWLLAKDAMHTDAKGRRSLVYQLAGSPLSGMNKCGAVCEDGKQVIVTLSPFNVHWRSFMELNQRYTKAKQLYQAYDLQEVLCLLHEEDNGHTDCAPLIDILFMKHEIDALNRRIMGIQEECSKWRNKYTGLLTHYNEEKMQRLYADYEKLVVHANREIDSLKEQKRSLKASLRKGSLDNNAYQRQLSPLKKRITSLLSGISRLRYSKVRESFPDNEDISFSMIEEFVLSKRK